MVNTLHVSCHFNLISNPGGGIFIPILQIRESRLSSYGELVQVQAAIF